jgi:endo-1,4-beta-D-glucanase Y
MRHPKSPWHSSAIFVALASIALLVGCAGPLRDTSGTGGTNATAGTGGTGNGAGTTGAGGTGGTVGTGGSASGTAGTAAGTGGRGGSAGAGGAPTGTAGTTGTGGTAGSGGVAGTGTAGGGSSGTAGTGGTGGTMPSRGPTPAANGVNFPFPQNRELSRCAYPTNYLNSDVTTAWAQFKTDTVVSAGMDKDNLPMRRIKRTSSDPVNMYTPAMSTVSEGIAYAMLTAVFMGTKDDQSLFDDLWRYSQAHLNGNGLMNWAIASDGSTVTGMGGATDADEDIAFALLMADKQWGGKGSLKSNYFDLAKSQINNIWLHEIVDSKLAGPGDSWGPTNLWNNINISYFAPAYYKLFKVVDSGHAWDAVVTTVYDTILSPNNTLDKGALKPGNMNTTNGLVPAWCTSGGDSSSAGPFNYQYDSCRTPFRIALDWCWFGETRAQMYLQKISGFFSGIGAANIVDGYDLNGNRHGQFFTGTGAPTLSQQSASFLGPAGVGAMVSSTYQTFITESYQRVATGQMKVGGAYYDESWAVMSLLMMTGNFLDYTSIQPAH